MKDREILQGGLLGFLALISSLPRSYGMVWSAVLFFKIFCDNFFFALGIEASLLG